jgi:hypothetical protein
VVVGLYQPLADDSARAFLTRARHPTMPVLCSRFRRRRGEDCPQSALLRLREDRCRYCALNVIAARCGPRTEPAGFVPQAPAGSALGPHRTSCQFQLAKATGTNTVAGPQAAQAGGRLGYEARRLAPPAALQHLCFLQFAFYCRDARRLVPPWALQRGCFVT